MKYKCSCGYIYDDSKEKTKFKDLPNDWTCPKCGASKGAFKLIHDSKRCCTCGGI